MDLKTKQYNQKNQNILELCYAVVLWHMKDGATLSGELSAA